MSLSRRLQRLRHKNKKSPPTQGRVLFEQLEPRLLLSTETATPPTLALNLDQLPAESALVTQPEAPTDPTGISESTSTGVPEVTSPNTQATITNEPTLQSPLDPPEVEPNNTLATATALPLVEDPAGSGLFMGVGSGRQDPAGSAWSDPDYWCFEAQAGDVVSISVDTPESNLNPFVELHNAADQYLIGDDNAGPDNDAFISHYVIPSSGFYYVKVGNYSATPDSYELRVDLARGLQLESDAWYSNDNIAGANALTMSAAGTQQQATVAGTVMAPEGSNTDEDYFALGALNVGNQVELNLQLPAGSTLNGMVSLVNSSGTAVADTDGNPEDGHFLATIAADGSYYAKVQSLWSYNGHTYLLTDGTLTWSQAEAYAQSLGGHLATVNDAGENEWVRTTFSNVWGNLWIGLSDSAQEDTWIWASGQAVSYTNWASGRPYSGSNDYDYAFMDSTGKWSDVYPSYTTRALIELDSAGTGGSGAGPYAQYLLDVDVTDLVPPRVTAVTGLPAAGTTTDDPVQSFTVSLSEALAPATAKAGTRLVWSYGGHVLHPDPDLRDLECSGGRGPGPGRPPGDGERCRGAAVADEYLRAARVAVDRLLPDGQAGRARRPLGLGERRDLSLHQLGAGGPQQCREQRR